MTVTLISLAIFCTLLATMVCHGKCGILGTVLGTCYHLASVAVCGWGFWQGQGVILDYARGYLFGWGAALVLVVFGASLFWLMKKMRKGNVEDHGVAGQDRAGAV